MGMIRCVQFVRDLCGVHGIPNPNIARSDQEIRRVVTLKVNGLLGGDHKPDVDESLH
jgi:hypothetical protein